MEPGLVGRKKEMNAKERIIECFETIAHGNMPQLMTSDDPAVLDLMAAQILIEPRIHALRRQVAEIYEKHGITDPCVDALNAAEGATAYIVGLLCGIDLAGRPDIVGRFAELYAREAKPSVDSLFTNTKPTALASIRGGRA